MQTLQELLERIAPTQRVLFNKKNKPDTYITFQSIVETGVYADDLEQLVEGTFRVTLFTKTDYTTKKQQIKDALVAAGYYINSVDGEDYETDTGYFKLPITIQLLK